MKVLTIKQPYLDLIINNYKVVEIRSWKTNYRGELYLHASQKYEDRSIRKKYGQLVGLEGITGAILAKCQLIDCILLTKELIIELNSLNYIYSISEDYIGYYGWLLTGVKKIEPIIAKGKLSIWEY